MRILGPACGLWVGLALVEPATAQEWTRFRGPNGTGISPVKTIPTRWSDSDINWKVALPGVGHSSPVIWGEKIFLLSTPGKSGGLIVHCQSTTDGRLLWKKEFEFPPYSQHQHNSFASSSPALDAQRAYVCWTTPARFTLMAFDHDGNPVWERDLGPHKSQHGGGVSPMVYRDLVILPNEQDGESFLLAVEAATGRTRWQLPRRSAMTAYSTPAVHEMPDGKPVLLFNSMAHGIYAVDPENGTVRWEYPKAFTLRSVSSPVVASGLVLGSCGSGGGGNYLVAVRPGAADGSAPAELAWQLRRSAPYVPTSVSVGELAFLWSDAGVVTCVHAPSGEIKYQERVGGNFFSSPLWVDGRIFCLSTEGEMVVLEASDTFKVLARNPLRELTHATPALAHGRMYVRTFGHLLSVGGQAVAPGAQ